MSDTSKFKINNYTESNKLFARALKVIPGGIYGHLGPAEGCSIPISAFPLFSERAEGAYFWDVDGNRFIDYMCAYGPNILGYNDKEVDAAALAQLKKANCTTTPSRLLLDAAECMVDTIEMADWAFFAKNGGDTTTLAIMTARAATGRKKIVLTKGYYHGVAPWTQKLGYEGIIPEDVSNNLYIDWNAPEQFEALIKKYPGEIAGFISTPYYHPVFTDNKLPAEGYWQKIRKLCDDNGIVLIFDDVRAGFRLDIAGSDKHYGVKADLSCFCKAIANGYNVSALCGVASLKGTVADVMYTGSYWMSAVPFAALVANINKLKRDNIVPLINEIGRKLENGLVDVAKSNGFDLIISGEPSMWFMRLGNDYPSTLLHQEWVAECVKRGVFFTNHHNHFINAALTDADLQYTWDVADEAYKVIRARHPDANYIK
ncbi:MAG: aminotransferase class III-fold pyridoxal phosphate-dependent enzyme [Christensenellales bacterium]|jgi:glutamate-1-semialdehyde 2,1-aminomutase|nr:aminotransferase class III-fold pyridoxal phosphate-dependent enzyme [Eubacteriales bacterium]